MKFCGYHIVWQSEHGILACLQMSEVKVVAKSSKMKWTELQELERMLARCSSNFVRILLYYQSRLVLHPKSGPQEWLMSNC